MRVPRFSTMARDKPDATAEAILAVVDAENPPLRFSSAKARWR
jgi:hypothetical protein